MAGRLLLVVGTLLVFVQIARGDGNFQRTRDGKTLVWNNHPKPGDVATWSGAHDRDGYARGFGQLTWYTKERNFAKPQFYARFWGRMVSGKFEGPVNVHANKKTRYAIFIDGARVTSWNAGTAPTRANARWHALVAKRRPIMEPEAPAAGPAEETISRRRTEDRDRQSESDFAIQDLWSERWPKIDIDESLRVLALPPRSLRVR